MRVREVDARASVVENRILSAARHIGARIHLARRNLDAVGANRDTELRATVVETVA